MREIAGPDRRLPIADADIHSNFDFGILHVCGDGLLAVARRALAFPCQFIGAELDSQLIAIGGLARFADGHHDSSPVCIFAGDGRFQ